MTGIEKITQRIAADAQLEIDEVLAKANAEAADITAKYEAQAAREKEDFVRRGNERADEREENLSGAASLEARKETLAAKQTMLDKAFALAGEKLAQLSDEDYISLLASLAAKSSFSGTETIILSAEDKEKHGDAVLAAAKAKLTEAGKTADITLSDATRPTGGGLLLSDGNIETNCTFEILLRMVREDISGEVAKILFA